MIEDERYSEAAIAARLTHLLLAILVAFGLVTLALAYWSVVRAEALAERLDNPRGVEAELRIQRGNIVDRNNVILAENTGPSNRQSRDYPIPEAGPATGFYSLRFGVTGIEESFDTILRGADRTPGRELLDNLLHNPPAGRDVRLTLDATLQQTGMRLLEGQQGALVLLEISDSDEPTADIRAIVSQPWYDPAELDELLENLADGEDISFFNRATQGLYQPGLTLLPLLATAALDSGTIQPSDMVHDVNRPVGENGLAERCLFTPEASTVTWTEAVRFLCPGAAADLGQLLGRNGLIQAVQTFGLTTAPAMPIPVASSGEPTIAQPEDAALGQDLLTVSPLQLALAYGALATGRVPAPRLVDAVQQVDGSWSTASTPVTGANTISAGTGLTPDTARLVLQALTTSEGAAELSVPVVSAADGSVDQWYVGVSPAQAGTARRIVVVVLEQPEDAGAAADVGQTMLRQATLQP